MQDTQFKSQFTATWNGKIYPVVFLIDYLNGVISFQDKPYHPSEVHTRPIGEVTLTQITNN